MHISTAGSLAIQTLRNEHSNTVLARDSERCTRNVTRAIQVTTDEVAAPLTLNEQLCFTTPEMAWRDLVSFSVSLISCSIDTGVSQHPPTCIWKNTFPELVFYGKFKAFEKLIAAFIGTVPRTEEDTSLLLPAEMFTVPWIANT